MRLLLLILIIAALPACRGTESMGFYQPMTMNLNVPDGPPEFKAGWHAGCKSAASNQAFANGFVYQGKGGPDYGSGVYQHDPYFGIGWRAGFYSCITHVTTFVNFHSMQYAPLSK